MNQSKEIFGDGINKVETNDMLLASDISSKLIEHYPGHLWAVNVNSDGGVVTIKALNVSGLYGYLLKLIDVQNEPSRKSCIMAGGEILERAKLARKRRTDGEVVTHIDGVRDKHQPRADGKILL